MSKKKNNQDFQKQWAKVVAKAWTDESFKQKLLKNPQMTLTELGIEFPEGTKIEIHQEDGKMVHLLLPQKPEGELSEMEIKRLAAGYVCERCWQNCRCS